MFDIENNEKRNQAMSLRGRAVGSDVVIFHAETNKAQSFLSRCCASDIVGIRNVITRRTLVRRGYLPEQGTHANKESLFASVTCFMRLPRRIQRMLLVMTIPALALIFTLVTTAESWADDLAPTSGTCNSSGTCLWNLSSDGTLNIYAAPNSKDVVMDHYECDDSTGIGNRPWEQNIIKIKNLVVGDNITNIGDEAFQNALNLETVKGMKDVKTIGFDCFVGTAKLQTIETPSVETLGNFALKSNSPYLKSVDLPNIKNMGYKSMPVFLEFAGLPSSNVSVNDSFKDCRYISNCSNENRAACGSCGDGYVMRGLGCVPDCGAGYLGKEGRCIDASLGCGAGYRQFENFCNRIRYTPAEAAEVLKDDNTNSVTITFRK